MGSLPPLTNLAPVGGPPTALPPLNLDQLAPLPEQGTDAQTDGELASLSSILEGSVEFHDRLEEMPGPDTTVPAEVPRDPENGEGTWGIEPSISPDIESDSRNCKIQSNNWSILCYDYYTYTKLCQGTSSSFAGGYIGHPRTTGFGDTICVDSNGVAGELAVVPAGLGANCQTIALFPQGAKCIDSPPLASLEGQVAAEGNSPINQELEGPPIAPPLIDGSGNQTPHGGDGPSRIDLPVNRGPSSETSTLVGVIGIDTGIGGGGGGGGGGGFTLSGGVSMNIPAGSRGSWTWSPALRGGVQGGGTVLKGWVTDSEGNREIQIQQYIPPFQLAAQQLAANGMKQPPLQGIINTTNKPPLEGQVQETNIPVNAYPVDRLNPPPINPTKPPPNRENEPAKPPRSQPPASTGPAPQRPKPSQPQANVNTNQLVIIRDDSSSSFVTTS